MDFGKQIRQIRKDAKLTQEQMAAKLNVSRQAVSNWENNNIQPSVELLEKLIPMLQFYSQSWVIWGTYCMS